MESRPLDKLDEETFTAVLKEVVKVPNEEYCAGCGARWYQCWCQAR